MKNKTILLLLGAIVIIAGLIMVVFMNIPAPSSEEIDENPEQVSAINIETVNFDFPETLDATYVSTCRQCLVCCKKNLPYIQTIPRYQNESTAFIQSQLSLN